MSRIAAFALVFALAACAPRASVQHVHGASMGTTWSARFVAPDARRDEAHALIVAELDAVVAQMSAWEPESALSRFNAAPAGSWQPLPSELLAVFEHALELARETGGAYDPTVAPLADLWGFGPAGVRRSAPPAREEIDAALEHVDFSRIELDPVHRRALQPGGVRMDISSLGPGHALDRIAARLRAAGIASFLVELGGEMIAAGRKLDGSDWRIAVEPVSTGADYDLVLPLRDAAAGSSGDYRVGFEHAGRRYSHTLDPRTGEPVSHALAGVTVIAAGAMQADALAAALMVLGPDAGMAFAASHDVAAVFTLRSGNEYERRYSPSFEAMRQRESVSATR